MGQHVPCYCDGVAWTCAAWTYVACVYVCFKRTLHVMAWRLLRHGSEADPQKLQKPRRIRLVARADFLPAHLNWHCGHAYTHSHSRHMRKRGDTQGHTPSWENTSGGPREQTANTQSVKQQAQKVHSIMLTDTTTLCEPNKQKCAWERETLGTSTYPMRHGRRYSRAAPGTRWLQGQRPSLRALGQAQSCETPLQQR